jgi:hypothetical protein
MRREKEGEGGGRRMRREKEKPTRDTENKFVNDLGDVLLLKGIRNMS